MPDKIKEAAEVLKNAIKTSGDKAAEDEVKKAHEVLETAKKYEERKE